MLLLFTSPLIVELELLPLSITTTRLHHYENFIYATFCFWSFVVFPTYNMSLFGPCATSHINLESIAIDQSIIVVIVVMRRYNVVIIMHTMVGYRFMACVDCMYI
jgi:hypothetical protein